MDEYRRRKTYRAWPFLSESDKSDLRWLSIMAGAPVKEHSTKDDLTELEEIQADYDEIWWHRRKALRLDWDGDPINSGCLHKAKDTWGHRGWGAKNSKQKTLRTHRCSRRKARNHRLSDKASVKTSEDQPHERRRKKRFGGREHCCGYEWHHNPETGRYRITYKYGRPNLDE